MMSKKYKQLKKLYANLEWRLSDTFLSLAMMDQQRFKLEERIVELEKAQPVRIVFTEVETKRRNLRDPQAPTKSTHPSPERFTRDVSRQPEFCE